MSMKCNAMLLMLCSLRSRIKTNKRKGLPCGNPFQTLPTQATVLNPPTLTTVFNLL